MDKARWGRESVALLVENLLSEIWVSFVYTVPKQCDLDWFGQSVISLFFHIIDISDWQIFIFDNVIRCLADTLQIFIRYKSRRTNIVIIVTNNWIE